MLVLMGIFKLGSLIKYMPRPVTIGFTTGIAVIIFTGQIGNFLGLTDMEKHERFLANMQEIFFHIDSVSLYSIITAGICLAAILLTPKLFPKVPGPLVGLIVSTTVASLLFPGNIPTIGTVFGEISSSFPAFQMPEITLERILRLLVPAFTIAMLGGIESLLSAVVADGMTNSKHNSNRELMGQGIANIVTPLFGGIPATGAIARTATNIKSGACSPMSGIIHGIFVLLTLLMLAPYASLIPLASMAPVLMVVAWNMSERRQFVHVLKMRSSDSLVLLATFLLTVFTSITTAVLTGVILAIILFAKRMSSMLVISKVFPNETQTEETAKLRALEQLKDYPDISIYTIEGPLFFGAAQVFEQRVLKTINYKPKVLILHMGRVPFMDATGAAHFKNIIDYFKKNNGVLLVTGVVPTLKQTLKKSGLFDEIGREYFFDDTEAAAAFAKMLAGTRPKEKRAVKEAEQFI